MSNSPLLKQLLRVKPIAPLDPDAHGDEPTLKRSMGLLHLTALAIGAVVGTGIFVVLSHSVALAGPAVIVSFLIAGLTAALSALCYAELASALPVSGSSYSYTYASLGEGLAFVVAACLLLEYGVSAAAVAVGWGQYLNQLLQDLVGGQLPAIVSNGPGQGGVFNAPAFVVVMGCTLLLVRGTRESAWANTVMVLVKLAILTLFIVVGVRAFDAGHLTPFSPYGFAGISAATASIFFSYIGFDAVSTASEEVKDPQRTIPRAIILSLVLVTALYVLVALVAIGAQPMAQFRGQEASLAAILHQVTGATWPAILLAGGAVISIFSVVLVVLYGQTRILLTMSRDGLLPPLFSRLSRRTHTPVHNTLLVGGTVALLAALVPLNVLADLTSMGTLLAFLIVSLSVMVLRRTQPLLPRSFRVPLYPLLPVLSIAFCAYLILSLPVATWVLFGVWIGVALLFYFTYSVRHSRLADLTRAERVLMGSDD